MKLASFLSIVLLTFYWGVDSISAITPGIYQFVSVVTDPQGNSLAITDQGLNNPIIMTPLSDGQPQQLWNVTAVTNTNTSFIVFAPSSNFATNQIYQVGFLGNLPGPLSTVQSSPSIPWIAINPAAGFTFADTTQRRKTRWGIANATNGVNLLSTTASQDPLLAFVPVRVA